MPEKVDVTVCWVFLVFISFTPCKLCSVVRGAVSLSVCVCEEESEHVRRKTMHLSSLVPEETWLPWTRVIIIGYKANLICKNLGNDKVSITEKKKNIHVSY